MYIINDNRRKPGENRAEREVEGKKLFRGKEISSGAFLGTKLPINQMKILPLSCFSTFIFHHHHHHFHHRHHFLASVIVTITIITIIKT